MSPQEKSIMMVLPAGRWPESGLAQARYAQVNNLSIHTLKYIGFTKGKDLAILQAALYKLRNFPLDRIMCFDIQMELSLKFQSNTPVVFIKSMVNL